MTKETKGYIFAALAAASYGTNPIFALPLYAEGMTVSSVLWYRYLIAVVVTGAMMLLRRQSLKVRNRDVGVLSIMGILMVFSSIFLFLSYNYLSAGIASTLLFFYPVMVALIMAVGYRERLSAGSIISLVMAFVGVAMISRGDDGTGISLLGFIFVMLSSLSYAIYLVYINRGPMHQLPPSQTTFYVLVAGLLVLSANCVIDGQLLIPPTAYSWFNVVGLGVFPTVISLIFTSKAIENVGSTRTAIFGALEPLTAVLLGILILGETLSLRVALGMMVIFVSVTLLMMRKK